MLRILTHTRPLALVTLVAIATTVAVVRTRRVEVEGHSMTPTLATGDRLAVLPLRPRTGGLVVVCDPRLPTRVLVKRCVAVDPDGSVTVAGDNAGHSTDSRHFGPVPAGMVLGRPLYRYAPGSAAGWVLRA